MLPEVLLTAESHLRDYLVQHLGDIEAGLDLFVDDNGVDGVEYSTPIGRIDILAMDSTGGYVVIELKLAHGPDAVCGQLMRYMGWVKRHLADGSTVRGIIVAQRISDRIRYAMADVPNVQLKEYELSLILRDAESL
jgi:RecB family endonuclease NucS